MIRQVLLLISTQYYNIGKRKNMYWIDELIRMVSSLVWLDSVLMHIGLVDQYVNFLINDLLEETTEG